MIHLERRKPVSTAVPLRSRGHHRAGAERVPVGVHSTAEKDIGCLLPEEPSEERELTGLRRCPSAKGLLGKVRSSSRHHPSPCSDIKSRRFFRKHRPCFGDDSPSGCFSPMPSERLRAQPFTEGRSRPGACGLGLTPQIRAVGAKRSGKTGAQSGPLKVRKPLLRQGDALGTQGGVQKVGRWQTRRWNSFLTVICSAQVLGQFFSPVPCDSLSTCT